MAQDTTTAMENLATATTTNITTFNEFTETISDQSSQITILTNKLLAVTEAIAKIKNEIVTIKRSNGYSGQGSGVRGDIISNSRPRHPLDPNGYCWTHQFKVS